MPKRQQKTYNQTIDILRIIAILAVVGIHTTTRTLEAASYDFHIASWTLFLNQFFRFGVPLFFMISGFVLELNYPFHASYVRYIKKRLGKIVIPYILWSFIYFFFVYTHHSQSFVEALLTGSASYQLYFIPSLLILYILFPLLHYLYKAISNTWILLILGLIQIGLLYYDYSVHPLPFFYPFSIVLLNYYVCILGMVASHHEEKLITVVKKWKILLIAITILCVGFIFFEGKNGYLATHNYLTFYSQWRPSVLVYTILLGSLLYYFCTTYITPHILIKKLATLSFLVFFIHVIVLEVIWGTLGKNIFLHIHNTFAVQVWFDPLFFLLTVGISFMCAYDIQQIPYLKKVSG